MDELKANCAHCGVGKIEARVGFACCDYCGTIVSVYSWVVPYYKIKRGEQFVFADEKWPNPPIRKNSAKIAFTTGSLAMCVIVKDLKKKKRGVE